MSRILIEDIDVEGWAFETLRDSVEFNALFVEKFTDSLSYYSSTPSDGDLEDDDEDGSETDNSRENLPALTTYYTDDEVSRQDEYRQIIVLPFTIRLKPSRKPYKTGGGKQWLDPRKLRSVVIKAIQVLQTEAESCGIDGNGNIVVLDGAFTMTEIGEETENIEAQVTLAFGIINTI